jgi:hypothetical protein
MESLRESVVMKKFVLAGLVGLAAWSGSLQAQIIITPPASPFFRPGIDTRSSFLYGGPRTLFTPGLVTMPAPTPTVVPGQQPLDPLGRTTIPPAYDYNSPMVTGHPTRFAAYAGYFSNQGGGLTVTPSTTPPSRGPQATVLGTSPASSPTRTPTYQGRTSRTPGR